MKFFFSLLFIFFFGLKTCLLAQSCGVSCVYGGGPFYKLAPQTIPEIRSSGYTTVDVWTIHINAAGNINFNAEFLAVANGQYVGDTVYPDFPANMALLKTAPTSVTRLEFGLSAWGSSTFANIKALILAQGTGPTSILYQNFKALKDTIPAVDAIDFDDESTYDVASSVQFAVMLADLGYKVTLCPYTSTSYWTSVASQTNAQRPGTVDAIYLQCYSGGSGNSPCSGWNFNGIPVYPGLWDSNYTPSGVQTRMTNWKNSCNIKGGFMWLYDDFKGTPLVAQYASAINTAIGIGIPPVATNPFPLDSSLNVAFTDTLKWSSSCAQSHDVYFGTTNPPPFVINRTDTNYIPGVSSPNTTYYWRIDEINFYGVDTGMVWRFTTTASTGIDDFSKNIFTIKSFPNPFNEQANFIISVKEKSFLTVNIYNVYGDEVVALASNQSITGNQSFLWNGKNNQGVRVPSGIYLMQISVEAKGGIFTRNLKLLRVD